MGLLKTTAFTASMDVAMVRKSQEFREKILPLLLHEYGLRAVAHSRISNIYTSTCITEYHSRMTKGEQKVKSNIVEKCVNSGEHIVFASAISPFLSVMPLLQLDFTPLEALKSTLLLAASSKASSFGSSFL